MNIKKKVSVCKDIILERPASVFCNRWMDGTPIGTGKTGVVFYGATAREHLIINRGNLYHNGKDAPVPDVSQSLNKMRELQSQGKLAEACYVMHTDLTEKRYGTTLADMRVLGETTITFRRNGIYGDYKRVLHLDTSEAEVLYKIDSVRYRRRYIASRVRDLIAVEIDCDKKTSFDLVSGFFRSFEGGREYETLKTDSAATVYCVKDGCYIYSSQNTNDGKFFGIAVRVCTDGESAVSEKGISVSLARRSLVLIKAFSSCGDREKAICDCASALNKCDGSYDVLFAFSAVTVSRPRLFRAGSETDIFKIDRFHHLT